MAQFDVFENPNRSTRVLYPYLIDIQSDLLSDLKTTVAVPLTPTTASTDIPLSTLHPTFDIAGKEFISMTTLLAGIDRNSLGDKVASLLESRDEIIASIDFMITGI